MRKILVLVLVAMLLVSAMLAMTSCGEDPASYSKYVGIDVENATTGETYGTIIIELYKTKAPATVYNFQKLVASGFYNGLTFHRVIESFMIQGGDPKGDGTGGSGTNISGEMSGNGFTQNNLKHTRGTVSMARSSSGYNTASSQFFIMTETNLNLDGEYAAFGRVIEGMDVVDAIAKVDTDLSEGTGGKPLEVIKMTQVYLIDNYTPAE